MFERIRLNGREVGIGDCMNFQTELGIANGKYGVSTNEGGVTGFTRVEMFRNDWRECLYNRGILLIDGFYEQDCYFHYPAGKKIAIPLLHDFNYDFVMITRASMAPVLSVYSRQPMIISDHNDWLRKMTFSAPPDVLIKEKL